MDDTLQSIRYNRSKEPQWRTVPAGIFCRFRDRQMSRTVSSGQWIARRLTTAGLISIASLGMSSTA
jgi:hypothetical protein